MENAIGDWTQGLHFWRMRSHDVSLLGFHMVCWHNSNFLLRKTSFVFIYILTMTSLYSQSGSSIFLLRLGVPQASLLLLLPRAVNFKVSCSKIPRRTFAGIRTHDPLVVRRPNHSATTLHLTFLAIFQKKTRKKHAFHILISFDGT
jgi:hypothetical protein